MAKKKDCIFYLLSKYPNKEELSNARVTKMLYLADWRHAIEVGRQITDIEWLFNNYGPFVWDVYREAQGDSNLFDITETRNVHGESKTLLSVRTRSYNPDLNESERRALDHVIEETGKLYWRDFIRLVYSTYPVLSSTRYRTFDLPALARRYKQEIASGQ